MNKIVDYKIVNDEDINMLAGKVNHEIAQGWQPYGPIVEVLEPAQLKGRELIQALVKYSEATDK